MSNTVIKPDRDGNFYVVWESIVEAPVFAGTWDELYSYGQEQGWDAPERRLDRADWFSSSALWYRPSWDEDESYMYEQRGYVYRSQMREFIESMTDRLEATKKTLKMLTPIDD